jgi:cytoskeletal protein CcmA (bactofilin family)
VSDTEIMPVQDWPDDKSLTESQIIRLEEARNATRGNTGTNIGHPPVSVIGESLHFKGELSAGEDLIIEGTVEGKIDQGKCCLTVKPNGKIIANVNATKIFIEGSVKGDLHATVSVTLRESSKVTGNIVAPKVALAEGAQFNGHIEMRSPGESSGKSK